MEAIVNNFIKAVGWSIIHSLWQGAIIYGILFLIFMAWPKMNAKIKYNISFGALFLMFISFCITFSSIFKLPIKTQNIDHIVIDNINYQYLQQANNSFNIKTETYFPFVVGLYILGIVFQFLVLITGYLKLKSLKTAQRFDIPEEWKSVFITTIGKLNIKKKVQFYLSEKVNVPLVVGFFKPIVLFPLALATQLEIKQLEAILIHELSHIRRNDYLMNLVKTCIETLLFFNPFVWLTSKFIHIEREHACDDLVVKYTGTPVTYAHALLKLELIKDKQTPSLSLAATGGNQHLYQRIKRITNMKTNYINAKQQVFILCLTLATIISLAWINPKKKEVKKPVKPASLSLINISTGENKGLHLVFKADTDTTKIKNKLKFVVTDKSGKKTTYTSITDIPDSVKEIVLLDKHFFVDTINDKTLAFLKSPEWKTKIAEISKNADEINKKFNSPEWKAHIIDMQKHADEMNKKYNSPEWKAKMEEMNKNFNSPEFLARMEETNKKFNSPEFKAKMEEMNKKFNSPEYKAKMAEIDKKFNSPEFKIKMEEMNKKFNSPEYKAKMAEIDKKFNSPEFKARMEEMNKKFNSPEYKAKMAEIDKKFNSPEFKAKMEEMNKKFNSPEYKAKMAEIDKKFNSPEFTAKMEEMNKKFNSPEWKEQIEYFKSPEFKEKIKLEEEFYNSTEYKEFKEKTIKELEAKGIKVKSNKANGKAEGNNIIILKKD